MSKWQKYFKEVTLATAALSTCCSKQVGSILVCDNRILCTGYNGVVSGAIHCSKLFNKKEVQANFHHPHHEWSIVNEIHAEANTLAYSCRHGIKTEGTTMYVSLSPCITCAKLIVAAGVKKVFYINKYERDMSGIDFLQNNNVEVEQI